MEIGQKRYACAVFFNIGQMGQELKQLKDFYFCINCMKDFNVYKKSINIMYTSSYRTSTNRSEMLNLGDVYGYLQNRSRRGIFSHTPQEMEEIKKIFQKYISFKKDAEAYSEELNNIAIISQVFKLMSSGMPIQQAVSKIKNINKYPQFQSICETYQPKQQNQVLQTHFSLQIDTQTQNKQNQEPMSRDPQKKSVCAAVQMAIKASQLQLKEFVLSYGTGQQYDVNDEKIDLIKWTIWKMKNILKIPNKSNIFQQLEKRQRQYTYIENKMRAQINFITRINGDLNMQISKYKEQRSHNNFIIAQMRQVLQQKQKQSLIFQQNIQNYKTLYQSKLTQITELKDSIKHISAQNQILMARLNLSTKYSEQLVQKQRQNNQVMAGLERQLKNQQSCLCFMSQLLSEIQRQVRIVNCLESFAKVENSRQQCKYAVEEIKGVIIGGIQKLKKLAYPRISDQSKCLSLEKHRFIYESIQCSTKKNINRMNLIFRKGQIQKEYRWYFMKNIPNTLMLIKTTNGSVIGLYSSRSYCGNYDEKVTKAVLFSIYPNVASAMPLKKDCNPNQPSQADIIIGERQIVIDSNLQKVFCDFDRLSSFHRLNKQIRQFWNTEQDQQQIQEMEIYRVEFDDEEIEKITNNMQRTGHRRNKSSVSQSNKKQSSAISKDEKIKDLQLKVLSYKGKLKQLTEKKNEEQQRKKWDMEIFKRDNQIRDLKLELSNDRKKLQQMQATIRTQNSQYKALEEVKEKEREMRISFWKEIQQIRRKNLNAEEKCVKKIEQVERENINPEDSQKLENL